MDKTKIDALMATYKNVKLPDGAIITAPARLSWPALFEPVGTPSNQNDKRYRITALFPLGADLDLLRAEAAAAAKAKFGEARLKALFESGNFKRPLIDQALSAAKETEKTKAPSVAYVPGAFLFRATTQKPVVVLGPDMARITDPAQVYPGMWCRFKITVRAYDKAGGYGVAFDLAGVQKIADDDKLGGGAAVNGTDGFEAIPGVNSGVAATAVEF